MDLAEEAEKLGLKGRNRYRWVIREIKKWGKKLLERNGLK